MVMELSWWLRGKESACESRRCGFDSWSRKISHALEQPSLGSRAREPHLLQPTCPRACAMQQEKPQQGEAHASQQSSPGLPQLEKDPHSNEDPAQPKINEYMKLFFKKKMMMWWRWREWILLTASWDLKWIRLNGIPEMRVSVTKMASCWGKTKR